MDAEPVSDVIAEIHRWREKLSDLPPARTEHEAIDRITALEELVSVSAAAPPVIDVGRVIGLELSVLGSHGMAAAEYPEMLDLVGDGRLRPQDLVTNVIGLEDAPAAMEMLGSSTGSGMTIIDLSR